MPRALLILAVLFAALPAFAQYEVSLKLDRINYVSQEPMTATVTIVNRSGADVILGGPGGRPWLSFNVKDSQERSHSPLQTTSDEPVIFEAGSTLARKVQLGETHSITEEGTYSITVSAYHPASGQYYVSNRLRFVITDAKPYGKPIVFGVPPGYDDAGRSRRYVIMVHRDMDRSYLYFRLVDDRSGQKLRTYQLGTVSVVREPQMTVDRENNLHVMFLAAPDLTIHQVIGPDGKPKNREFFRDTEQTRPMLFLTRDNTVVARGGLQFDPVAENKRQQEAASKVRSVSDRPPGL